jgi:hypothetical protein
MWLISGADKKNSYPGNFFRLLSLGERDGSKSKNREQAHEHSIHGMNMPQNEAREHHDL